MSVRAGESGGSVPSAGLVGEDLFLAPQAVVAEEAPVVSLGQSLPMVKPCPYTDVRLQDAADSALHVGALVVYPECVRIPHLHRRWKLDFRGRGW